MPRKRLVEQVNYTVIVIALVVTAIDALSKVWARHELTNHPVHVGGAIWLQLEYNSGFSFSFNQSRALITSIVTIIVALDRPRGRAARTSRASRRPASDYSSVAASRTSSTDSRRRLIG